MKIEYNEKNKVKKKMEKKKMKRRTRRGRSNGEEVFIYLYVFVCGERERESDIWVTSFVRQRTINLLMDLTTELFIYLSIDLIPPVYINSYA